MRVAWLAVVVALAGCASENPPPGGEPLVAPAVFTSVDAPWAAYFASGCGLCSGEGGFGPQAEHFAFFVFADGSLALIDFNARPGGEGFRVAPEVDFDESQLASWLADVERAEGEVFVVRVHTARALDAGFADSLRGSWVEPGPAQPAADYGVAFGVRLAEGGTRNVTLNGPLHEGDPFEAFTQPLQEHYTATLDEGRMTGVT